MRNRPIDNTMKYSSRRTLCKSTSKLVHTLTAKNFYIIDCAAY